MGDDCYVCVPFLSTTQQVPIFNEKMSVTKTPSSWTKLGLNDFMGALTKMLSPPIGEIKGNGLKVFGYHWPFNQLFPALFLLWHKQNVQYHSSYLASHFNVAILS